MCFVYRLAILYDIESLRSDCEKQISFKTMDVFATDDFLQCDRNVLNQLLNLDTFSCSEKDVFGASIVCARACCKKDSLDETKAENLRTALGDGIHLIRFASMSAQEFAAVSFGMNGFFSADELLDLIAITTKGRNLVSTKFNQSLRQHPWSLVCDRFVSRILNDSGYGSDEIVFKLNCEKPIRLYGLVLGFKFIEGKKNRKIVLLSIKEDAMAATLDKVYACKYYEG